MKVWERIPNGVKCSVGWGTTFVMSRYWVLILVMTAWTYIYWLTHEGIKVKTTSSWISLTKTEPKFGFFMSFLYVLNLSMVCCFWPVRNISFCMPDACPLPVCSACVSVTPVHVLCLCLCFIWVCASPYEGNSALHWLNTEITVWERIKEFFTKIFNRISQGKTLLYWS